MDPTAIAVAGIAFASAVTVALVQRRSNRGIAERIGEPAEADAPSLVAMVQSVLAGQADQDARLGRLEDRQGRTEVRLSRLEGRVADVEGQFLDDLERGLLGRGRQGGGGG